MNKATDICMVTIRSGQKPDSVLATYRSDVSTAADSCEADTGKVMNNFYSTVHGRQFNYAWNTPYARQADSDTQLMRGSNTACRSENRRWASCRSVMQHYLHYYYFIMERRTRGTQHKQQSNEIKQSLTTNINNNSKYSLKVRKLGNKSEIMTVLYCKLADYQIN